MSDKIVTANNKNIMHMLAGIETPQEYFKRLGTLADGLGIDPVTLSFDVDWNAEPAYAFVNRGVWCGKCPRPTCSSEMILVDNDDGFICGGCFNPDTGRKRRPLVWPSPEFRSEIERLLLIRLDVANRNWFPVETIDDLKRENLDHGLGV